MKAMKRFMRMLRRNELKLPNNYQTNSNLIPPGDRQFRQQLIKRQTSFRRTS